MRSTIRRKLDMAKRVLAWCRAHSNPSPGYTEMVAQLEERVGRAQALADEQGTGRLTRTASTRAKKELRGMIREQHLRHLVRIARSDRGNDPELAKRFRLPSLSINGIAFASAARAMAAQALLYKDLFIKAGMPPTFLDDLNSIIGNYEAAVNGQFNGLALSIGARVELFGLGKDLVKLVQQLDSSVQFLWQGDLHAIGSWTAAKDIVYPRPGTPETTPAPDIRPAA